jgi:hypothetical protein
MTAPDAAPTTGHDLDVAELAAIRTRAKAASELPTRMQSSPHRDRVALLAEVDRLTRERDDARRREADAWDDGRDAGHEDGWDARIVYDQGGGDYPAWTPNPYRAALVGDTDRPDSETAEGEGL